MATSMPNPLSFDLKFPESQSLIANEMVLPATVNAPVIRDSNGRCWKLSGLRENVGNITHIEDFEIVDDSECCEMCLEEFGPVDDIYVNPEDYFPESLDYSNILNDVNSESLNSET